MKLVWLLSRWLLLNQYERWKRERGQFTDSKLSIIELYFYIIGFHNGPLNLKISLWKMSMDVP